MAHQNRKVFSVPPDRFPLALKTSAHAPKELFALGTLPGESNTGVAFVGTRRPSPGAEEKCRALIRSLKGTNAVIISGLAQGIDSFCHRAALREGIPTIAVLAQGLETPLHGSSGVLARQILESGGGLLSEYPGETPAYKSSFPARNRIIAGLSAATVLVESKTSGGAMITARFCLKEHRELLALPGDILHPTSGGAHELLRCGQAKPVWFAEDLPLLSGVRQKNDMPCQDLRRAGITLPEATEKFWRKNAGFSRTIQELEENFHFKFPLLLSILTELEIAGLVRTQDGYWFHFTAESAEIHV
ncbi:MAG: DNA-protecting protein DprA [Fibrobacter sp.]|jgi:DNA processing protein|nr:DNA-protecting protein DprA [Fibrobacter sp.]